MLRAQFAVLRVQVELLGEALHGGRRQLPRLSVDVREVVAGVFQLAAAAEDQPADRCWRADITETPTWEGKLYLAYVQDLYRCPTLGWAMAADPRKETVIDAL